MTGSRRKLISFHPLRCPLMLLAIVATILIAAPATAEKANFRRIRNGKQGIRVPVLKADVALKAVDGQPEPTPVVAENIVAAAPEGTIEAPLVEQVRKRLDQEFAALNRQRATEGKPPQAAPTAGTPRVMIDLAQYGMYHFQTGPSRFIALHLLVDNPTAEPLIISRGDITAKIDGEAKPLSDLPNGPQFSFSYGAHHQNLQNHTQIKEIKVPGQGVAAAWLIYPGLPMSSDVPPLAVTVLINGKLLEVDVTQSQRALLHLTMESLGPRDCLRVLTVRGMLNTVNVQSLVTTLEQLADQKVVRTVLQWTPDSIPPEQHLSQWLVQSAIQIGTGRPVNEQLPTLPATIREFHLVPIAGHNFPSMDNYGRMSGGQRMHTTLAEAVSAALKSAYLALPPAELVLEIQQGHPLARAAALRHGAARLSADGLAIVLPRMQDENPEIRIAAVRALSQFGDPAALTALVELAGTPSDPLSQVAVESLASSRFSSAQTQLLALLRRSEGEAKQQLMHVLARFPRPQWSDEIYAYVIDPRENLPLTGVQALLQVGHPRLIDVLETCLKSDKQEARDLAFPILAQRSDVRSERLATAYALAQLEKQPPDGTVVQFLHRTKLTQSLPLLLKHLDAAPDKATILNLLGQIGDESTAESVAGKYAQLQNNEKSIALNTLRMLRYPNFHDLAGEALLTNDGSMVAQATQGLMQDGGPAACQLLISALDQQTQQFAIAQICNALGNVGSPEARVALLKARESDNPHRKNPAISALQNLYQRSPGFQYIHQAQDPLRRKKWDEALEFFEMALQIDPELPEALAGRANVRQRQGKTAEAIKDFEKAYELDPYNHLAVPGLAIVRVQAGKIDDGLKILNNGRERYQHDPVFLYNSACVYAQAFDQMRQQKDLPADDKRPEEYRAKAISELQLAVTRGFADFDVARDDPDFKVLRDDAEFKKIVGNRPAPADDQPADAIQIEE